MNKLVVAANTHFRAQESHAFGATDVIAHPLAATDAMAGKLEDGNAKSPATAGTGFVFPCTGNANFQLGAAIGAIEIDHDQAR
jgi:hypothetical protein